MRFILPFTVFLLFSSPAFAGGSDSIIEWWEKNWWEEEVITEQKPVQKKQPQKSIENIQERLKKLGEMIEQRQLRIPPKEFLQRKK